MGSPQTRPHGKFLGCLISEVPKKWRWQPESRALFNLKIVEDAMDMQPFS